MDISSSEIKRFYFSAGFEKAAKARHLPVIAYAAIIVISLFTLLYFGLRFEFDSLSYKIMLPSITALFAGVPAVIALIRFGYRGSYIPFFAVILLMTFGMTVQTRMHIKHSDDSRLVIQAIELQDVNIVNPDQAGMFLAINRGLKNQVAAWLIGLFCLVATAVVFSGSVFEWLGKKYMLLFAAGALILFILVVLSMITDKGKFLFSRTPWELLKIIFPLSFAGYFAYNGRFFRLYDNGKLKFSISGWGPFLVMSLIPVLLFVLLGDLGQVLIYLILLIFILYLGSDSILYPAGAMALVIICIPLLSYIIPLMPEYVAARFELWYHFWAGFPSPEWWDRSYQTANAFFAMKAGGVTGTGLGLGQPDLVPLAV